MDAAINKRPRNKEGEYELLFFIGAWRKYIPEHQMKLIIAEALNYCVISEKLIIKGYLITNRKVYLLLKCEEEKIHPVLFTFYKQVQKGIRIQWQKIRAIEDRLYKHHEEIKAEELFREIFLESPLVNDWLIKLIKGQEVTLSYYDPHLERLKNYIHHTNFCSAIDYSGAIGPVVIKGIKQNTL